MTLPNNGVLVQPATKANTRLAYESIKQGIASGTLAPGEWIREFTVASSLGLSRTPVREALRALAAEGIVELEHNRGARVIRWAAEDIDEVYRLRALLEGYGATLAARHASDDQVAWLRELQDRYERVLESGVSGTGEPDDDMSAECNDEFHGAVVTASGSARLATLLAVISSAPLVQRALQHYTDDDRRRSVVQHRDIVTAIQNRDEHLAQAAMSSHILAARYSALRVAGSGDA
jgi:DNA-binding GntR family transcriptional regulator